MSLTAKDIAEIARLLDESHFSSLDLQVGDFRLKIRRDGGWSEREADDDWVASKGRKLTDIYVTG